MNATVARLTTALADRYRIERARGEGGMALKEAVQSTYGRLPFCRSGTD